MSSPNSHEVSLLCFKLSLLVAELLGERNLVDRLKESGQSIEDWSRDMSGHHKYVLLNTETYSMSEVNHVLAWKIAGGVDALDAGNNIQLYVNDQATRKKLSNWGVDPGLIATYIKTCVSADYWLVSECLNYLLNTANPGEDHHSVANMVQKDAIAAKYYEMSETEESSFGTASDKDYHEVFVRYVRHSSGKGSSEDREFVERWIAKRERENSMLQFQIRVMIHGAYEKLDIRKSSSNGNARIEAVEEEITAKDDSNLQPFMHSAQDGADGGETATKTARRRNERLRKKEAARQEEEANAWIAFIESPPAQLKSLEEQLARQGYSPPKSASQEQIDCRFEKALRNLFP